MRKLIFVVVLCLLWSGNLWAGSHPKVTLKDQNGNLTTDSGYPVSVRKSCGKCHDIDFIANGYHFQQGRLALMEPEVYKKNYYDKYIDKKGKHLLPKKLSAVVDGGMYGNLEICPHPSPLNAENASNPGNIGLTTPKWDTHCGLCHLGGGPMEKDRSDKWLYNKTQAQIEKELKSGTIPGDYVLWNKEEKQFKPFSWNKYGIHNVSEPSCFICHSKLTGKNRNGLLHYREAIGDHYFAAANTLGGLLADSYNSKTGKLNYNMSIDVDKNKPGIQIDSNIIGQPDDTNCAQCHAGWTDDVDKDGKFTPKDVIIQFLDPKTLQSETPKNGWVWFYNDNDKDEDGIAKRIDIHKDMGLGCIDCHSPVGDTNRKKPSHDFAKGNTGPLHRVRWHQLAGTASCEKCHDDALSQHIPVFGPSLNARRHLDKISCTLCHISKRYSFEAKLIDETAPLYSADYDPKTKIITTEDVFIGMPYLGGNTEKGFYADLGLLPERKTDGSVTWKYKPVNAAGLPYFLENSTGSFKVAPERYLLQALKVDANLSTFYVFRGDKERIGDSNYLNLHPAVGIMAKDKALNNGTSHLAYALPNYIDVNFNDRYDKADVAITDDVSLGGNKKDGIPEINSFAEVKAAIFTLSKIIEKATNKPHVTVKLSTSFNPFSMSHNVRPKNQALSCFDCHGEEGKLSGHMFTSKASLYYPYDPKAVKAGYVELDFPRTLTEQNLADRIKEKMLKTGFGKDK